MRFLLATSVASMATVGQKFLAPEDKSDSVEKMTARLEHMVSGLGNVKNSQQDSQFAKLLGPYVSQLSSVLKDVKNSKSTMSEKEKKEKLQKAQEMLAGGLATDMAKFGQKLVDDDISQKTSILLGVLLSRKDDSLNRQMEVITDKQFADLPVVKYVLTLEHKQGESLVTQVASYLDAHPNQSASFKEIAEEHLAPPPQAEKAELVKAEDLNNELKKIAARAKDVKWAISVLNAELQVVLSAESVLREGNLVAMKGTLEVLNQFQKSEADAKDNRPIKTVIPLMKSAIKAWDPHAKGADPEKVFKDQIATTQKEAVALRDAKKELAALEMAHLETAKSLLGPKGQTLGAYQKLIQESKELESFLSQLRSKGLIHSPNANSGAKLLLQLSVATKTEDCPYCKAACIEKCHDAGHSFMQCLGTCEDDGTEEEEKKHEQAQAAKKK